MPSIARKNLLEDIPRFLVAQAGIMFAVGLVTIQTGIQAGFTRSTSELINRSEADIWVASENMVHLGLTVPLPYERLSQAQAVEGVDKAEALIVRGGAWRNPQNQLTSITLIGFDPEGQLFSPWNITEGRLSSLKQPYTVIVDETSLNALNAKKMGDKGVIGSLPAEIVGLTKGTQSLVLGNLVFTSVESAYSYITSPLSAKLPCGYAAENIECTPTNSDFPPAPRSLSAGNTLGFLTGQQTPDPISFVLVRAKTGQDLEALKQKLQAALPNTRTYTRTEMSKQTQVYWAKRSGIGFVLGIGAVVGVLVGVVIVGQILYSSVSDHLKEFGTLKAMGSSNWVIYGIIVEQALWMAVLGYIPGIVLCLGVAAWTSATQGILILITPLSALGVFGITVGMCIGSAIFAIQKVTRVDPAIVFKG